MFYDIDGIDYLYAQSVYEKLQGLRKRYNNILSIGATADWFRKAYSKTNIEYNVEFARVLATDSVYNYNAYDLIFIFDIMCVRDVPEFVNQVGGKRRILYGNTFIPCEFLLLLEHKIKRVENSSCLHIIGDIIEHENVEKVFAEVGEQGHVLCGPHITLGKGSYVVEFDFSLFPNLSAMDNIILAKVSCQVSGEGTVIAEKNIYVSQLVYKSKIALFFSLDEQMRVEFPVFSYGSLPFAVKTYVKCLKTVDYIYDDWYAQKVGGELLDVATQNNGFHDKLERLKKGLTVHDQNYIQFLLKRLIATHTAGFMSQSIITEEELKEYESIRKEFFGNIVKVNEIYQYQNYQFSSGALEPCGFYYKLGLKDIDTTCVHGRDAIDAGAFLGDTSIVLSEFGARKVYAFEPEQRNYELLLKTIELNALQNIIPMNYGLGDAVTSRVISSNAGSSTIQTSDSKSQDAQEVRITSIDVVVEECALDVGIIKMDVEGYERNVLKGAEKTIKKFKPIIVLSIYHSAEDLLELKPILDSFGMSYRYKVIKMVPYSRIVDTVLLCY